MEQETLANSASNGRRKESSILQSAAAGSNLPPSKKARRKAETKLRVAERLGHYFFASGVSV